MIGKAGEHVGAVSPSAPGRAARDVTPPHGGIGPGRFRLVVLAISLAYLALELVYVLRLPLVMDEFQGAHDTLRFASELPYRDFRPYKTVLGYYSELPLLLIVEDWWRALLAVKIQLAITVAVTLAAASLALARRYRHGAVLVALGLLVSMSTFLERSADLRVDMLTAIAGLACLLLLLERRFALAGFAAGLGFLFSQKGIYYVVSANAGLASWWLLGRFPKAALRATLVLNAAIAALVLVYVLVWSAVADIGSVVRAVFLSPAGVALADPYSIQLRFWAQTVVRNPAFYGLVPAAMLYLLLDRGRRDDPAPTLLLGFGATLLALCLWHKQPWPYFFVLLLPTLFVIHVAFLDGLARTELMGGGLRRSGLVALVALGVLYPLGRVRVNLSRDNGLQRLSVRLVEAVLEPGDTYLAAVSLVPSNDQAVASLTWLDRPRLTRLQNLPAGALQSLADSLRQDPPKLYVQNYRTQQLPAPLTDFLRATYTHLWGNVFTYAPPVQEGLGICPLAFTGRYSVGAVEDQRAVRVRIAGRVLAAGDTVTLVRGSPACSVEGPARLVLSPTEVEPLRDPRFREPGEFFPNVYGY